MSALVVKLTATDVDIIYINQKKKVKFCFCADAKATIVTTIPNFCLIENFDSTSGVIDPSRPVITGSSQVRVRPVKKGPISESLLIRVGSPMSVRVITKSNELQKSWAISNVHLAEGGCLGGCRMAEPRRVDIHRSQIHPPEHPHTRANRLQGSSFPQASKIPTHPLALL